MSDVNRQRAVIDLDELERQLREAAGPVRTQRPVASDLRDKEDPLAELARIVGQDDPFKSVWPERRGAAQAAAPAAAAREPSLANEPALSVVRDYPVAPTSNDYPQGPEALEAELRQVHAQAKPSPAPSFADELAGYGRAGQGAAAPQAPEPRFEDDWAMRPGIQADTRAPSGYELRARSPGQDETEPVYEPQGQLPPHDPAFDEQVAPPPKRRRGLVAVAAMGTLALAVGGGYAMLKPSSGPGRLAGAPPLIAAETGPSKVQPQNPGGVEVPNQERQVFNKGGSSEDLKTAKVVTNGEQPVDVQSLVRRDVAKAPTPPAPAPSAGPGTSTTAAAAGAAAIAALAARPVSNDPPPLPELGQPRRVKTVSVRPDGTIIDTPGSEAAAPVAPARVASLAPGAPTAQAAAAPASAAATSSASGATPVPAPKPRPVPQPAVTTSSTTTSAPAAPRPTPAPAPAAAPRTTDASGPLVLGTTPGSSPRPVAAPRPQQVAAVQPAATETTSSGGSFAVQLAAPGSEQEARETIGRLQRRFSDELSGMSPGIRKAEVNGKTIYRVRVGGMSRDEATALCSKLQASGGQCFVAKN